MSERELRTRLSRAITRAEEWAGTMPAKEAVKLRPADWHAVCKLAREAAAALSSTGEADGHPTPTGAIEALAESWASIDGKLDKFEKGKKADAIDAFGGHYAGYMAEAEEMARRLRRRGFVLAAAPKRKEGEGNG